MRTGDPTERADSEIGAEVHNQAWDEEHQAALRAEVIRTHGQYDRKLSKMFPICPWCDKPILLNQKADLHEALVKRGSVPKDKQVHIFTVENCILLHHNPCHMDHGQTVEMTSKCLLVIVKATSASRVANWYRALREDHELWGLSAGTVREAKVLTGHEVIRCFNYGCKLKEVERRPAEEWIVGSGRFQKDYRAWVGIKWWQKKNPRWAKGTIPAVWAGLSREYVRSLIDEGYHFEFLCSALGLDIDQLLR